MDKKLSKDQSANIASLPCISRISHTFEELKSPRVRNYEMQQLVFHGRLGSDRCHLRRV